SPRPARERPVRKVFMLVATREDGSVLLERRPESGIWGGLWCLPEFTTASAAAAFISNTLGTALAPQPLAGLEHTFTHFDLTITPLLVRCPAPAGVCEEVSGLWYNIREPPRIVLPAPITAL